MELNPFILKDNYIDYIYFKYGYNNKYYSNKINTLSL